MKTQNFRKNFLKLFKTRESRSRYIFIEHITYIGKKYNNETNKMAMEFEIF